MIFQPNAGLNQVWSLTQYYYFGFLLFQLPTDSETHPPIVVKALSWVGRSKVSSKVQNRDEGIAGNNEKTISTIVQELRSLIYPPVKSMIFLTKSKQKKLG